MLRLVLVSAILFTFSCAKPGKLSHSVPPAPQPLIEHSPAAAEPGDRDEDSYGEAARFYLQKRLGVGSSAERGELPIEKIFAAKRHAEAMPRYSLARHRFVAGGKNASRQDAVFPETFNTWQPLGPGNIGGRTRSLVIHPTDSNTMWAGSVGGGVWKTVDGGASWLPLSDLLPSIGIGALAIDPANPSVLYAGTGEWYTNSQRGDSIRGAGIFKTIDGGTTWTQLPGTTSSSFYYVNKLVVSPNDSNRVYAATYGGIWYSPDAGNTWRRVLDRASPNLGCQDLVIRTDRKTDFLFAACGTIASPQTVVFRNSDAAGAGAWEPVLQQPNMGRTSLALAPSNQNIVYAVSATVETGTNYSGGGLLAVYASQSNGDPDSWETRVNNQDPNRLNTLLFTNPREAFADVCSAGKATYSNQGSYDNTIAVDPADPNIVWVGGIDLFRSDDGGRNWGIAAFWQAGAPQLAHADNHALVFAPGFDGAANQTLFAASDGGIYKTRNARAATAIGDRAACSPYPTQVAWTNLNNGYAVTQFYHGTLFPGGAAYMGGAQDNGTSRGSDATGPNAWLKITSGDGAFSAVDPTDPNLVYASTQNLSLLRSVNGAASFSSAIRGITEASGNFLFIVPFTMDPVNPKRLYLGGRTLWRTDDGAQNWSAVSASIGTASGSVSAIAVSPADPNAVVFGTSTGQIYYSRAALSGDSQTAWSFSLPRTGYLSRLAFDPADSLIVYAVYSQFKSNNSQNHVYKSLDGGATWAGLDGAGSTALPDVPVFTIVADPLNPQNLYLGTDLGVFLSLDGGATWAHDENPFADAVTETLTLDRSAGQSILVAFTHGRGAWKLTLPGSGRACDYTLSSKSIAVPAFGGTYPVTVTTDGACSWSAVPSDGFALIQSPAGGRGTAPVNITVAANPSAAARTSAILIQNQPVSITQEGASAVIGNDELVSAFSIPQLPWVGFQDTAGATENIGDPLHSCTASKDYKTLWFTYTARQSGILRLSFKVARSDRFGDAGSVLAAYNFDNGVLGAPLACSVTPVADAVLTTRFPQIAIVAGSTYAIEVSATVSGAAPDAAPLTGLLTLTAQLFP